MKQRDAVKMTREEAEAFLNEGMRENWPIFLATNGPGGYPHIVSMGWVYQGGRVWFQTYGKSQKILNLRRDPKAAVMLEAAYPGGFEHRKLRGLMIRGICAVEDNPEKVVEVLTAMWRNGAARNASVGARPQNGIARLRQTARQQARGDFLPAAEMGELGSQQTRRRDLLNQPGLPGSCGGG